MSIGSWEDTGLQNLPRSTEEQRRRAARLVATMATSATDAAELLAILGLVAQDGQQPAQCNSGLASRASA